MTQSRWWSLVAAAVATVTGLIAGYAPLNASETCDSAGQCFYERSSFVSDEGLGILLILLVPAIVALLPVLLPRQWLRIVALALLSFMALIAIATVGMFLIPTLVFALVAVGQNSAETLEKAT